MTYPSQLLPISGRGEPFWGSLGRGHYCTLQDPETASPAHVSTGFRMEEGGGRRWKHCTGGHFHDLPPPNFFLFRGSRGRTVDPSEEAWTLATAPDAAASAPGLGWKMGGRHGKRCAGGYFHDLPQSSFFLFREDPGPFCLSGCCLTILETQSNDGQSIAYHRIGTWGGAPHVQTGKVY